MSTLYRTGFYLMKETKKPTYLKFYDLNKKELSSLCFYVGETVRYRKKWFFVTHNEVDFYKENNRDRYPVNWIKYLYKERKAIKEGKK